jgi:hypothetical protein
MSDVDLVNGLQSGTSEELITLIETEIDQLEFYRSSVVLYEATNALLRQPAEANLMTCWIKIFDALGQQQRTNLSKRLAEIKPYIKNADLADFSREIPFIQWAFLDQAPINDPVSLNQHLRMAREAFIKSAEKMICNKAPYFELTGIWLGVTNDFRADSNTLKIFCRLPMSLSNSFLENLNIRGFDNSHFRRTLELELAKKRKKSYWNYLLEISVENTEEINQLKPNFFSKVMPKKRLVHEIIEKDDSIIGETFRRICKPKMRGNKKKYSEPIQGEPRIAVLISGQMRNFQAGWSTQKELIKNLNAEIFVSTWENTGRKAPDNPEHAFRVLSGDALSVFRNIWAELGTTEFQKRYASIFGNNSKRIITIEEISKLYGISEKNICLDSDLNLSNNSEKMYYRWQRAVEIFDFKQFDVIVRIRPDSTFENEIDFKSEIRNRIYAGKNMILVDKFSNTFHRIGMVCGDSVAVGQSNLMIKYLNTHKRHKKHSLPVFGSPSKYVAHGNLAWNLNSQGIEVRKLSWNTGIASSDASAEREFVGELNLLLELRFSEGVGDLHDERLRNALARTYGF